MDQSEILQEIDDYTRMLTERATNDLEVERFLLTSNLAAEQVVALNSVLRQRQRDYSVMLRMMQLVRRDFLNNGDWMKRHRLLWSMKKQFDLDNAVTNQKLYELYHLVRENS